MNKYIDAEAFKRRILSYGIVHEGDRIPIPFYKEHCGKMFTELLRWVCEEADDALPADVQEVMTEDDVKEWCIKRNYALVAREDFPSIMEVRHGRWIVEHGVLSGGIYGDMGKCSVCGVRLRDYEWDYCPNCGSRMDLEGDEE